MDDRTASPIHISVDGVIYALELGGPSLIARIYLDYELVDPSWDLTTGIMLDYELVDPSKSLTAVIGLDYTVT